MASNKDNKPISTTTARTGSVGEALAVKYLKNAGFTVIETNYRKKWGELDIVARNKDIIHFIEVKTNAYRDKTALSQGLTGDNWQPEDRVHAHKLRQIEKTLETWIMENGWEGEWQIDVVSVRLVHADAYAVVDHIKNITEA